MQKTIKTSLAMMIGLSFGLSSMSIYAKTIETQTIPVKETKNSRSNSLQLSNAQLKQSALEKGNWDAFNYAQLNRLILEKGHQSPNYDPKRKPYVVFDFDNTSVFLDIEEASLIYQLENLNFKVTPAELNKIIRIGISEQNFVEDYNNKAGQPVSINTIAPDIIESYTWLYQNYVGLKGKKTLTQVKENPHYQNFITKMRYLYAAIGDTFDHDVSYPWVTYLFAGFKPEEVSHLALTAYQQQQKQAIGPVTWTSPESLKGKAGAVSVTWENGLRPYKDVRNLYQAFMNNGFDVYVCSASFIDVIKGVATDKSIGFNVPKQNIYAMELKHDQNGRIKPVFNQDYYQTQGKGKTLTIQKFLVSKYGYGPVFISGDSEGDQNMMQDFKDTEKVLIINRLRKPTSDVGKFSKLAVDTYGQANAKYLLQGRDANTGEFIPSNKSLAFGANEAKALK
ncbi:HAD family hydrolase [Acinetobacter shaoyimingii]|uniref:haloacid dehalogenase-like hydrolase n=1 Tax=Acinetobacter shaoyimingii TaxID=2715164 RepID=UPI001D0F0640|nr:haloacid dehalogenase-like hydrolase [Acinetobacter shaoyimingii]